MIYEICEDDKCLIQRGFDGLIVIKINDFNSLINDSNEKLIKRMIKEDEVSCLFHFSESVLDLILDFVIHDKNINELKEGLVDFNIPFFSFAFDMVRKYKKDYKNLCELKNSSNIVINCNLNNINKGLDLAVNLNIPATIYCTDISLETYKEILKDCNFEEYDNCGIKIFYQDCNSSVGLATLYKISHLIGDIVNNIRQYNLSPIEKIMYVYDIVKQRKYKKDNINVRNSCDLDKVLTGDFINCSGYSNLFNAILKCLGIKAMPLASISKKHQRSIVYVKDEKYNIDGVYVFDPTWDSKTNNDDNHYIDKYYYFAMPIKVSNISAPEELFETLCISYDEIVSVLNDYDIIDFVDIEKNINIKERLKLLFEFVDNDGLNRINNITSLGYVDEKIKEKLSFDYNNMISKYFVGEIDMEIFIKILYNTRRIQYLNGFICDFNIENIKHTVLNRYMRIKKNELKQRKNNSSKNLLLELLDYNLMIADLLEEKTEGIIMDSLYENVSFERDKENIKLIKLLKEISFDKDNKKIKNG